MSDAEKKSPVHEQETPISDDDLSLEEMTPWALPWKAISITVVALVLIAGAIQIVGLASNRINRLSKESVRTHGKEPGNFRPMGGVVPRLSSNLPVVKDANGGMNASLMPTKQIAVQTKAGMSVPKGFVYIPPGPFLMGGDDPFANFDEKPVHKVFCRDILFEKPWSRTRITRNSLTAKTILLHRGGRTGIILLQREITR